MWCYTTIDICSTVTLTLFLCHLHLPCTMSFDTTFFFLQPAIDCAIVFPFTKTDKNPSSQKRQVFRRNSEIISANKIIHPLAMYPLQPAWLYLSIIDHHPIARLYRISSTTLINFPFPHPMTTQVKLILILPHAPNSTDVTEPSRESITCPEQERRDQQTHRPPSLVTTQW